MGFITTHYLTCDGCCSDMTDRDGVRTGNYADLREHAKDCGWTQISAEEWHCAACSIKAVKEDRNDVR